MQDAADPSLRPDYDAVIVSSSPVCLMTGLVLRAQGKRVLIADDSPRAGGAWITTELGGFSRVEVGCHLIDPDPDVYGFMSALGISMEPLRPQPFVYSRAPRTLRWRLPYGHRWLRDLYDLVGRPSQAETAQQARNPIDRHLKPAYRVLRHASKAVRGHTKTTLYPPQGCDSIIRRLLALADATGLEIRTSTPVTDVSMDRDAGIVSLRLNEETVTTSALYLTAGAHLTSIADGEEQVELAANPMVFQNLYLVLADCEPRDFTYAMVVEDRLVHRVSDLTRFAIPQPGLEGAKIFGVTVDEFRAESEDFALDCLARLKEYGLVNPEARLLDYVFLPYRFTWLDVTERGRLRHRLAPLIHVIDSESMTRSIKNLLRDEDVAPLLAIVEREKTPVGV